jgi:hypothetical protein
MKNKPSPSCRMQKASLEVHLLGKTYLYHQASRTRKGGKLLDPTSGYIETNPKWVERWFSLKPFPWQAWRPGFDLQNPRWRRTDSWSCPLISTCVLPTTNQPTNQLPNCIIQEWNIQTHLRLLHKETFTELQLTKNSTNFLYYHPMATWALTRVDETKFPNARVTTGNAREC